MKMLKRLEEAKCFLMVFFLMKDIGYLTE